MHVHITGKYSIFGDYVDELDFILIFALNVPADVRVSVWNYYSRHAVQHIRNEGMFWLLML